MSEGRVTTYAQLAARLAAADAALAAANADAEALAAMLRWCLSTGMEAGSPVRAPRIRREAEGALAAHDERVKGDD